MIPTPDQIRSAVLSTNDAAALLQLTPQGARDLFARRRIHPVLASRNAAYWWRPDILALAAEGKRPGAPRKIDRQEETPCPE